MNRRRWQVRIHYRYILNKCGALRCGAVVRCVLLAKRLGNSTTGFFKHESLALIIDRVKIASSHLIIQEVIRFDIPLHIAAQPWQNIGNQTKRTESAGKLNSINFLFCFWKWKIHYYSRVLRRKTSMGQVVKSSRSAHMHRGMHRDFRVDAHVSTCGIEFLTKKKINHIFVHSCI